MSDSGRRAESAVGYRSSEYAECFSQHGQVIELSTSGAWVLERPIPHSSNFDATGLYPLMVPIDGASLPGDLEDFKERWVSLVAVSDPFDSTLQTAFKACSGTHTHFKDHYVTDLSQPVESYVAAKRLRQASRAEDFFHITVERDEVSDRSIEDCWKLYDATMERVEATGLRRFSAAAFRRMLRVPGVVCFVARDESGAIAMQVDYHDGDFVYAHLAASNDVGRRLGAAAAINIHQIRHYDGLARWIDSGSAPGSAETPTHGLARFKKAFSNRVEPVYLCKAVFDARAYEQLSEGFSSSYFPAYREGELN